VSAPLAVLIVGGYGFFGKRLVELLRGEPRLVLYVAGRSEEKAREACAAVAAAATLLPSVFDRDGDPAAQLAAIGPDLVIDASGPFQAYGERPYRLVEASIARGIHYLDLADAAQFVNGMHRFDGAARERGVFALSGASTLPALTAAAVRRLSGGMARVRTVTAGIAPSPHAGLGRNVVRAIASYAGRSVKIRRGGRTSTAHAFTEQRGCTIAPPGRLPLRRTLFSLIDAPDPEALPELWPELRDVWIGVGPVPQVPAPGVDRPRLAHAGAADPEPRAARADPARRQRGRALGRASQRDVRRGRGRDRERRSPLALVASRGRGGRRAAHSRHGSGGDHPQGPRRRAPGARGARRRARGGTR
jgi:hypothetical protein